MVNSTWTHRTVLLNEAIEALHLNPDSHYIDATFGRGGHSRLILSQLSAQGRLTAIDKDLDAIAEAKTIADARFAKPLDRDLILSLARNHEALITIEEGAIGGFGSHVAHLLAEEAIFDHGLKFRSMVLPDTFIDHASPEAMYRSAGMDAAHIEAKVLEVLDVAVVSMRA